MFSFLDFHFHFVFSVSSLYFALFLIFSFAPWLNRSLDLLGDDLINCSSRNSQAVLGYLDPEELEDPEEQLYEYNISYHDDRNITFEDNGSGAMTGHHHI